MCKHFIKMCVNSGEIIYYAVRSIHINLKICTHWSGAEYLVFWGENRALKKKFCGVMRFHKVTQNIFIGVAEYTLSDKIHLGAQSLTNWPIGLGPLAPCVYFSGADSRKDNFSRAWLHLHPKCNSSNARRISAIIDHHRCSANTHRLWSWDRAPNVFLLTAQSVTQRGPRAFACLRWSQGYLATTRLCSFFKSHKQYKLCSACSFLFSLSSLGAC